MTIRLHRGDLPDLSRYRGGAVAIDTETMGLDPSRDRLCVVQLSPGDGTADVVQIPAGATEAPNLTKLLADGSILKIFHFARFDLGALQKRLAVMPGPVYCTKIASRLARTYTDKHGLKDLVREVLGIELSKQQQSSDWGADDLTDAQVAYAASDVLHLHALKERSTPCWRGRDARTSRRPAFASCPTGSGSISPAGRRRIFLPIPRAPTVKTYQLGNFFPLFPQSSPLSGRFCLLYS